jgi:hypothetical protein
VHQPVKQLAGCAQLHAARQPIEKFEAEFFFEILDLPGEGRLSHAQSARGAPVMLFLANRHEVSQVSQFHTDSLSRLV